MSNDQPPRPITFQPSIYRHVEDLVLRHRQGRVLDAGAGQGYLARRLKDAGMQVEACDFLEENFRCPDIPFRKADLNLGLPYPDQHFDCVVSVEVIEHIENHFTFARELVRVTRPGGRIIITTPNTLSLSSRWHSFLYGYCDCAPLPLDPHKTDYFMQHINPIGLPRLLFLLERNGARLENLSTNRLRRGSLILLPLVPLLALALRLKLRKRRHHSKRALHDRHLRWMLSPSNLLGRITIAEAVRR